MKLQFSDLVALSLLDKPRRLDEIMSELDLTLEGARAKMKKLTRLNLVEEASQRPSYYVLKIPYSEELKLIRKTHEIQKSLSISLMQLPKENL